MFRGGGFGLALELDFHAPGLSPNPHRASPGGLSTSVKLAGPDVIAAKLEGGEPVRLLAENFPAQGNPGSGEASGVPGGKPDRTIDWLPGAGYVLYARGFGSAWISEGGESVLCAPPGEDAPWSWQRFLVGQVLPWAALLHGQEVFHAGAVGLNGRAVALLGDSGWGKTSLVLRMLGGAGGCFLADDVLAVRVCGETVYGYPGANIAAVRDAERDSLGDDHLRQLGTVLGHSGKTYLEIDGAGEPLPLGALVFLRGGSGRMLEPIVPTASDLLAATFVLGVRTPARMIRQLDICARMAQLPAFVARPGASPGPQAMADAIAAAVAELGP